MTNPPSLPVTSPARGPVELPILSSQARPPAPRGWRKRAKSLALRLYRLGVVLAIVWLVHRHHAGLRVDGDARITVEEVKPFLPTAAKLGLDESDRQGLFVSDAAGRPVGYALRTAPISNKITGYAGPTDTLVVLGTDGRVVGIRIRSSFDTKEHVGDVARDEYFLRTWTGKTWDEVAGMDPRAAGIEGVSGASLTSLCIANGIRHRFRHVTEAAAADELPPLRLGWRDANVVAAAVHIGAWVASVIRLGWHDAGVVAVVVVALLFAFTHLRSRLWARRTFQVVLIGYLGFWNGQILAQSLLGGWAASTVPWRTAPALVLLAAAALIVPWTSRRALYCSQICPHGAAQEWMGRLSKRRLRVPRGIDAGLRWMPPLLVGLVLVVTMLKLPFDLAGIEPFDAYLVRSAGVATIAIAVAGLVAALFVPMAYCKYGCPTGAVLSFVRSHGKADTFGRRDVAAGLLVLLTGLLLLTYDVLHHRITG